MEKKELTFIQDQIGYTFKNKDLLRQAFVRRSYSQEHGGENNEVLEFIGDKALDFAAVRLLAITLKKPVINSHGISLLTEYPRVSMFLEAVKRKKCSITAY